MKTPVSFITKAFKTAKADVNEFLLKLKVVFSSESHETQNMLKTYARYLQGEATEEEMDAANEQFRDVIKTAGLGAFLILPGSVLTIPALVMLGRKVGIDILPTSFSEQFPDLAGKKKTDENDGENDTASKDKSEPEA